MRELKGDWRDLFNGFMLALDLRKMFLGFIAIALSVLLGGWVTVLFTKWAVYVKPETADYLAQHVRSGYAPHELWNAMCDKWDTIYASHWVVSLLYTITFLVLMFAIWGLLGGAICRIAAYEIAKDGERIETSRAVRFARQKFWSFFFAPVICVIGFLFFAFCVFGVGFLGRVLDLAGAGGPILAVLFPLAILAGFIMTLIVVGTFAGAPLFGPAVAAEGTDSFDAVSRGFSYVYSRPWHFAWYQGVAVVYGVVCVAFVFLFAVTMADLGAEAGTYGFDVLAYGWVEGEFEEPPGWENLSEEDQAKIKKEYLKIGPAVKSAWRPWLSEDHTVGQYDWSLAGMLASPEPYARTMNLANVIVKPDYTPEIEFSKFHFLRQAATVIISIWLLLVVGHAYGYAVSYLFSQQTMIYFVLRKKVDGIEMNEVFEEAEDEGPPAESAGQGEKKEGEGDDEADDDKEEGGKGTGRTSRRRRKKK